MSRALAETAEKRSKAPRDMTCAIMTRFYRAPESILTEDYDKSVDIWGVGVILAELLLANKRSKNPKEASNLKSYMFPGGSCYPQSPAKDNDHTVNSDDQIFKILERFPNLDQEHDFSFVSKKNVKDYIE